MTREKNKRPFGNNGNNCRKVEEMVLAEGTQSPAEMNGIFLKKWSQKSNEPGIPPILYTSSITYFPLGLRSAMNGTRSDTDWKSSIVRLIPTECAIAMRCSTAFVEPPRIIVNTYGQNRRGSRMRWAMHSKLCMWYGPLRSRRRPLS